MPLPLGPPRISYAACLSDQAVRSPAGLISCRGLPVIFRMLPGRPDSPWPASMDVESRSTLSSYATCVPAAADEQFVVPGASSRWLNVTS
jgi:hypothetical protein